MIKIVMHTGLGPGENRTIRNVVVPKEEWAKQHTNKRKKMYLAKYFNISKDIILYFKEIADD